MKKGLIVILILSLAMVAGGCSKNKPTMNAENNNGVPQITQNPQFKLVRTLREIEQLEKRQQPITKEQAQKLIPIVTDIKTQTTVVQEYADAKATEINNILTTEQKILFENRQGGAGNGQRNNRNETELNVSTDKNNTNPGPGVAPANNSNAQTPPTNDDKGNRAMNGSGNGNQGPPQGMKQTSLKDICDSVLKYLEEKVK